MFDLQKFQEARLGTFGHEIFYYPEIDSTSRIAAEKARENAAEGSIVFADCQTQGRGRGTHTWFSPANVNLYFTVILYPENQRIHYLPFLSGLAISLALDKLGIESDLKWPNDVLVRGKKIAGILIQTSLEENRLQYALVGIGINLNVMEFPPELKTNAVSASQILGHTLNREEFFASLLYELEKLYENRNRISWEELSGMFRKRSSYVQGCDVEVNQEGRKIAGVTAGLDSMGGLILKTLEGTETIYAGDVLSCRKK
jgi:BirA family transcriptional regulator, biotin operon repressor / biotin---[acetyl-CoA-carboxylase] ligase